MTSDRRFEQDLPGLLEDLFLGPMPAYRDIVLERTARTRQRPAWTLLLRWLPGIALVRRPVLAPVTWRTIWIGVALLALLVAMVAAFVVGTRPNPPLPFGLARNGLIAYATNGDIYTVDPVTGVSTVAVAGPETDGDPQWSRDGLRFAFVRYVEGSGGKRQLYVARADGTDLRVVTPEPIAIRGLHGFSPDGSQILLTVSEGLGTTTIVIVKADGRGLRSLDVGTAHVAAGDAGPSWRPPDGVEILFLDGETSLHAVNPESGVVRTIVGPYSGRNRGTPKWSPDGSRLAYIEWMDSDEMTAQIHVIEADGTGDLLLPIPPGAIAQSRTGGPSPWQAFRSWSNDGTRVVAIRGYSGGYEGAVAVVLPVDGSGFGVEIDYSGSIPPECCPEWEWAPDDTSILGTAPNSAGGPQVQVLLDPVRGTATAVPWTTSSLPTWQRLAP